MSHDDALHVFTDSEESVVAKDIADARVVMHEWAGGDVWSADVIDIEQLPDDQSLTIVDGDSNEKTTMTCAQWARNGRGYLCGPV
jgi:hypothetical protein